MRKSLFVASTAMCAALYFFGSYLTSYIESPWGIGQFRPAVVIPFYFAVVFGPLVGGVGAAVGTLLQSILRYGQPWLSLVSGTPANFLGFYMVGLLLHRRFSWVRFVLVSTAVLLVANFVCALGVLAAAHAGVYPPIQAIAAAPPAYQLGFVIGLTLWWFVTMMPFVLVVVPPLLRATPFIVPAPLRGATSFSPPQGGLQPKALGLALLATGAFTLAVSYVVAISPAALGAVGELKIEGIKLLFGVLGAALVLGGVSLPIAEIGRAHV